MRNLNIKRKKSFVASLMKVKLYISDESSNELTINGVKCRKIGDLANGKEASFEIEDKEVILFAIIDKLTKETCNDKIIINAGDEDVYLSGKNKFAPFSGNPFVFDK